MTTEQNKYAAGNLAADIGVKEGLDHRDFWFCWPILGSTVIGKWT
jgi:hypothetical protein